MTDLASVLMAFKAASGCDASVWSQGSGGALSWEAATNRPPPPERLPSAADGPVPIDTPDGPALITAMPGARRAWLVVGPSSNPSVQLAVQLQFLLPVVAQFLSVRISRTLLPKSESLPVSQLSMSHEDDFA